MGTKEGVALVPSPKFGIKNGDGAVLATPRHGNDSYYTLLMNEAVNLCLTGRGGKCIAVKTAWLGNVVGKEGGGSCPVASKVSVVVSKGGELMDRVLS